MRCTTTFYKYKALSHWGIFVLVFQISSNNKLAGMANIDGSASNTCIFIYHIQIKTFIKKKFECEQATPNLLLRKKFEYLTIISIYSQNI